MDEKLTSVELRVLGALIEKQMSTPDYYPMTINALINACNQKSNRDPVVAFDEKAVESGLFGLRRKGLAKKIEDDLNRVPKYAHCFLSALDLDQRGAALLCELALRGPQTVGELRGHAKRLHGFSSLGEVEQLLPELARRDEPLVLKLPRQPGTKERRWAHLLGEEPPPMPAPSGSEPLSASSDREPTGTGEGMQELLDQIADMRRELDALRNEFADFKKQFE